MDTPYATTRRRASGEPPAIATKSLFGPTKKEPSLTKIIVGIVAVGIVALGGLRAFTWIDERFIGSKVEAEAATNLDTARQLAGEGKTMEARALLDPILSRVDDPPVSMDAFGRNATIALQPRASPHCGTKTVFAPSAIARMLRAVRTSSVGSK